MKDFGIPAMFSICDYSSWAKRVHIKRICVIDGKIVLEFGVMQKECINTNKTFTIKVVNHTNQNFNYIIENNNNNENSIKNNKGIIKKNETTLLCDMNNPLITIKLNYKNKTITLQIILSFYTVNQKEIYVDDTYC